MQELQQQAYVCKTSAGRPVICFGMSLPVRNWANSELNVLQLLLRRWYLSGLETNNKRG
ncbi:hypothetical protein DPMN_025001 [Dreissena polymorpha]|uniref:Uncharacterized protein n=1 Tax=Dreissena polymorpha TaxID=45954 RepID=A0A9D4LPY9_DREPO|nr:hypothetical protein DPMN_025001 [Dreissena polymorpha]